MMSREARTEVLSVRLHPDEVRGLREAAKAEGRTLSDLMRDAALAAVRAAQAGAVDVEDPQPTLVQREIALTVHSLRVLRDQMERVPAVRYYCGNIDVLTGGYDHSRCPAGCGQSDPDGMWSRDAWDLELAARRLEKDYELTATGALT